MSSEHATTDPVHVVGPADAHDTGHDHAAGAIHVHVVPPSLLLAVFGGLLVLTVLTVGVTYVDLGQFNIWIALLVAVAKAGLVAMYFMHLRWDSPFNGIALISALLFVAIFMGTAMLDSHEYQPNLEPPIASNVQ